MLQRILLVALGLAPPILSGAQGNSVLSGRIIDATGVPIVGARVRIEAGVALNSAPGVTSGAARARPGYSTSCR